MFDCGRFLLKSFTLCWILFGMDAKFFTLVFPDCIVWIFRMRPSSFTPPRLTLTLCSDDFTVFWDLKLVKFLRWSSFARCWLIAIFFWAPFYSLGVCIAFESTFTIEILCLFVDKFLPSPFLRYFLGTNLFPTFEGAISSWLSISCESYDPIVTLLIALNWVFCCLVVSYFDFW